MKMRDLFIFRPEYSLYVGDLSPDVDDLTLYQTFAKRYPSCRAAKGKVSFFNYPISHTCVLTFIIQ